MTYQKHISRKRREMLDEPLSIVGASHAHHNIRGEKLDDSEPSRRSPIFKGTRMFKR